MSLSSFHPTVRRWFEDRFGAPTPPQTQGWPHIRSGENCLIAAPTGSGKTLAAFLSAIDSLLAAGDSLEPETRVLYVSPLKALGNDVAKNLEQPLRELEELDPALARLRVAVRSGDTPASQRASMLKKPPHIFVTTPESLYILLTSKGGRGLLRTVRTVIVDEIHAVLGSKRGAHLALSLERLENLVDAPLQRIGLSATQKPLSDVANVLCGVNRECAIVDVGHLRDADLAVCLPNSPLRPVCSHEVWDEIYENIRALIEEHRTSLIFVGSRKMAERVSARLTEKLGADRVTCHHSSLSKERRLDAETRLKSGSLSALVATASLELGIDVGEIDLVCQVGATRSIATFLQRIGRSGHAIHRTPKGRLFPLTEDEFVEAAALMRAVRRGELDRTPQPFAPLDILAQQIVAETASVEEDSEAWREDALFELVRRAHPFRSLERADFDQLLALHSNGRYALLHRDPTLGTVRATRRARLVAMTSGGAIPDKADYRVHLQPGDTFVGTVDEDFAIESSAGDVFQLGSTSWRVLKLEGGKMLVADAAGVPPSLPFWFGEAPARTAELSAEIATIRERGVDPAFLEEECGFDETQAKLLSDWLIEANTALGAVPTCERLVLERFFDATGGMQLVLHAPFGGRINRALGLALRKRFCRSFGFELQAAANEEAVLLSLGPQHSFPLEEVFNYLRPQTAREMLVQALLPTPIFNTRWRWNVNRSLLVERMRGGKRIPPPILRMRADDLLGQAFPDAVACGENLPAGDLEIPWDHVIVRQTLEDCMTEYCDVDGFLEVVRSLQAGSIERVAVDRADPSPYSRGVLNAAPYAFLDDAPLEERRAQAVWSGGSSGGGAPDPHLGELDPEAVRSVRAEAWPDPRNAEEVHEALTWMGYVTAEEAKASEPDWTTWLEELRAAGRVEVDALGRFFATQSSRDPIDLLRGRLQALGPVLSVQLPEEEALQLQALEAEGCVMRAQFAGEEHWCDRRLLQRARRYTLDRLRKSIRPVSAADFLHYLAGHHHLAEGTRASGPNGLSEVLTLLSGFEAPAGAWEKDLLRPRLERFNPDWLDRLLLHGEFSWGRLWGSGSAPIRSTPIAFFPRAESFEFEALSAAAEGEKALNEDEDLDWRARAVLGALRERGASFTLDLERATRLLPSQLEEGLRILIAWGLVTCDSFLALRQLLTPAARRRASAVAAGRWSLFGRAHRMLQKAARSSPSDSGLDAPGFVPERSPAAFTADILLRRYGVVFRRLLERERFPVPWREILFELRARELAGAVRGGRFVTGFSGEQYALPAAVAGIRKARREREADEPGASAGLTVGAADPLNLVGILTPEARVPGSSKKRISL